jgi:phage terminase large subunit-like protein
VATAPRNARARTDHGVVLDDMSLAGPPEVWAAQVVAAVHKYSAEGVVAESNQGGDMVRAVIHGVDPSVKVTKITARQSKYDRAEPVSTLYAQGFWHHAGYFAALESQQVTWVPADERSPDRIDALVHVATALIPPLPIPAAGYASTVRRSNIRSLP